MFRPKHKSSSESTTVVPQGLFLAVVIGGLLRIVPTRLCCFQFKGSVGALSLPKIRKRMTKDGLSLQ